MQASGKSGGQALDRMTEGQARPFESQTIEETIKKIIGAYEDPEECVVRSFTLLQPAQGIYRVESGAEDSPVYEFIVDVKRKKVMYKFAKLA